MATRCALPWLLAAAVLCGAAERCPSCGAGTERRLLEEAAKRQLLDGLRLRERPRIAHAVPRVAVARALRRLQADGPRRGDPPEDERRFEIISFAEEGGCGTPMWVRDPPVGDLPLSTAALLCPPPPRILAVGWGCPGRLSPEWNGTVGP